MNAPPIQFRCPHCAQLLELYESSPETPVSCPTCGGSLDLNRALLSRAKMASSLDGQTVANYGRVTIATIIGAAIGYALTWNGWLALVGALVGFLGGRRRMRRAAQALAEDERWQRQQALAGLRSVVSCWILLALMWSWVLTRPAETFHDQGGMVLTFFVFPLTLVLWILGGPVAFARGWRNRWRVLPPELGKWVLTGLTLSGLLILAGVVSVALLASR